MDGQKKFVNLSCPENPKKKNKLTFKSHRTVILKNHSAIMLDNKSDTNLINIVFAQFFPNKIRH